MRGNLFLVGRAPGRHPRHDPERHALFPYPPNCAGSRLKDMMGLSLSEYVAVPRRNVIPHWPGASGNGDAFPMALARECARDLLPRLRGQTVLFVGKDTARACGCVGEFLEWHRGGEFDWAVAPHPSGRNRWYNDTGNREAAREFLLALGGEYRERLQRVATVRHRSRP